MESVIGCRNGLRKVGGKLRLLSLEGMTQNSVLFTVSRTTLFWKRSRKSLKTLFPASGSVKLKAIPLTSY